jgi:ribonuclease Z
MLGRTGDLCVYGPKGTDEYLEPILDRFCAGLGFKVKIITFDASKHAMLMDDSSVSVYTIPLQHRIPAAGFLFAEKPTSPHLIREMLDFYRVPVKCMASIKQGNDYVTEDGEVVPNNRLTRPATPPKKYAYCSDTSFLPEIVPLITGVDLLYHEATFMEADGVRAGETNHSTAVQAAEIARMANVKKLMLGHFSARYEDESMIRDEAMKVFPNVILADEGFQVDV